MSPAEQRSCEAAAQQEASALLENDALTGAFRRDKLQQPVENILGTALVAWARGAGATGVMAGSRSAQHETGPHGPCCVPTDANKVRLRVGRLARGRLCHPQLVKAVPQQVQQGNGGPLKEGVGLENEIAACQT